MNLKNPSLLRNQAYINGTWINAIDQKIFSVLNPATEEKIIDVADTSSENTKQAIEAAQAAFLTWSKTAITQRSSILKKLGELVAQNRDDLATILTMEMGKPINESKGEIDYTVECILWAAEECKRLHGDVLPAITPSNRTLIIKQPIGVVGAITPWNFPSVSVTHKIIPAIAAGCTVVLKPAEDTPLSALALAVLADEAGIPAGVLNILPTNQAASVGNELLHNPIVKKITFTGSTKIGKLIMRKSAETVKKVALELGGNAPFIVFEDADLDNAVQNALAGKFSNAGQICISTNRFLVHEKLYDAFVEKLNILMNNIKVGAGIDPNTTMGPLVNIKAIEKIEALIEDAVSKGAKLIRGGKKSPLGHSFFEPTLLANVTPDMLISKEEIFGPVAAIQKFTSDEEALQLANDTSYGLASYFFTTNIQRLFKIGEALEYGSASANTINFVSEAVPFGGFKESGFGREGGKNCIEVFCETKCLNIGGF